jgi:uncharacterized protein
MSARVRCPTCRRDVDWNGAPYRPFCSERCRLIDLGAWFSEQRGIAGDRTGPEQPQRVADEGSRGDH